MQGRHWAKNGPLTLRCGQPKADVEGHLSVSNSKLVLLKHKL